MDGEPNMLAKKFVVIFALMLSFMAALAIPMAHAEDYPARVIKIVVPLPWVASVILSGFARA